MPGCVARVAPRRCFPSERERVDRAMARGFAPARSAHRSLRRCCPRSPRSRPRGRHTDALDRSQTAHACSARRASGKRLAASRRTVRAAGRDEGDGQRCRGNRARGTRESCVGGFDGDSATNGGPSRFRIQIRSRRFRDGSCRPSPGNARDPGQPGRSVSAGCGGALTPQSGDSLEGQNVRAARPTTAGGSSPCHSFRWS